MKVKSLSHVQLSATLWTAAHQAPPSMGFSMQEYWSGVHCLLRCNHIIKCHLQIFFSIFSLSFYPIISNFCRAKVFNFHKVQFINVLFDDFAFGILSKGSLANLRSHQILVAFHVFCTACGNVHFYTYKCSIAPPTLLKRLSIKLPLHFC